ncbi:hypothetical protein BH09CHL1_BH09CHL1_30340 [soil metagenome]
MNEDLIKRLEDALDACREVKLLTGERPLDEYEIERAVQLATERLISIIGEALSQAMKIEPGLEAIIPDVQLIIGMRHRIIHNYDGVDDAIVFDVARTDVSELERHLSTILEQTGH